MISKKLKLGDVCQIGDGNHSSNYPKASEMVDAGIPFLRAGNIQDGNVVDKNMKFILPEKHEILKKGHLRKGDLLITNRGEIGKLAIVPKEFHGANLNSQIAWLRPDERLLSSYLYYYLKSPAVSSSLYAQQTGTALQQLTIRKIRSIEIFTPPITEQQRIVAKLDAAFSEIDNSERILKDRLKKLSILFNSYIEEKLRNLKNNFPVVELKEVIKSVQYGTSKKCSKEGEYPVLRMGNMQGGKFDLDDLVYLDDQMEANKYQISKFDVFFNRTNSALHVGKSAIWEGQEKALFAGYLIRVNYEKSKVDPYFLNFFLNVESTRKYGYSVMTESINQANINGTKLKQYPFVRADLDTQKTLSTKFCDLEKRLSKAINLTKQSLELYGKLKEIVLSRELEKKEL